MPRTGSTSLFHILGQHPAVFRPFRKEMGYFLFNHHKGERWYLDAYRDATDEQRCIDVTPEYFFHQDALDRIRAFGNVRVIIGVRSPASFAESLHKEYGKRYAVPPLEQFIESYGYRRGSERIELALTSGLIRRMLAAYADAFGPRVLFYRYDAFRKEPLRILEGIEKFAGVPQHFDVTNFRNVHANRGDRATARWLSVLLSAEPLIHAASTLVPAAALRRVAGTLYGARPDESTFDPIAAEPPSPPWLVSRFAEDEAFIDELFGGRVVVDGRRPLSLSS